MSTPTETTLSGIAIQQYLIDEIYRTLGLSPTGLVRKLTGPIFSHPTRRLSQIASEFDTQIKQLGPRAAFQWLLPFFANGYQATGQEHLPTEGPLLVIANHPGTMDTILISSILPRDDLKIIAGYSPFTQNLPHLRAHLIYSAPDTNARAAVVRTAIHHLNAGGALLLYPSGQLEPDPATLPGAVESLQTWSRSVELFLRAVPATRLVSIVVSHVLLPQFLRHPLARFRKQPKDRQRVAEFLQVIYQLLFPKHFLPTPSITLSEPVCAATLQSQAGKHLMPALQSQFQQLLEVHRTHYALHFASSR
ncbi:MAG: 1-acyl-sn-glycerol-3-phosphate acyltransferase [Anaerolineales bacterium]